MRSLFLAGLALIAVPAAAMAQAAPALDWRIVSVETAQAAAYAPSTVRRSGQLIGFFMLWRWRDPLSANAAPDSILARRGEMRLVQLNCATGQIRNGGIRYFGADLRMMAAKTGQDEWGPMDRTFPLFAAICGDKPLPGEAVATRGPEQQLALMGDRMAALAAAAPPVNFTPVEKAAILCSERAAIMQSLLLDPLASATEARKDAISADYEALSKIIHGFDGKHPSYPNTPEGRAKIDAQSKLIDGDAAANAAYERFERGDRAPLLAMMRRCDVMSGAKALSPTFGTW
jgi:hypothetical protein